MANINKVRVGGTNYDIEDTTARINATNAQSTAETALNNASTAQSTANGKADITNTISNPWLCSIISDSDSIITLLTASIRETNIGITTAYGTGLYWADVRLYIPSECQPTNGFYSVEVTANMLNNPGAVTCCVMYHSKSEIIVRMLNPVSGSFTFDLMIQALGY